MILRCSAAFEIMVLICQTIVGALGERRKNFSLQVNGLCGSSAGLRHRLFSAGGSNGERNLIEGRVLAHRDGRPVFVQRLVAFTSRFRTSGKGIVEAKRTSAHWAEGPLLFPLGNALSLQPGHVAAQRAGCRQQRLFARWGPPLDPEALIKFSKRFIPVAAAAWRRFDTRLASVAFEEKSRRHYG